MLPLVCNDAVAILFMFDLSRRSSLASVKEWYRAVRGFNKVGRAARRRRGDGGGGVSTPHPTRAGSFLVAARANPRRTPSSSWWAPSTTCSSRCLGRSRRRSRPWYGRPRCARATRRLTAGLRLRRAALAALSQARKFAKAMKAPLIFTSAASAINIKKLFKIILITVFALANNIEAVTTVGDPIVEF